MVANVQHNGIKFELSMSQEEYQKFNSSVNALFEEVSKEKDQDKIDMIEPILDLKSTLGLAVAMEGGR